MDLRPSLAGSWYPQDRSQLLNTLDQLFQSSDYNQFDDSRLIGLVVPHAGLQYSGHVAVEGFQILPTEPPEHIVILSPLHRYSRDPLLTSGFDAYQTPLGTVPIDKNVLEPIRRQLHDSAGLDLVDFLDENEHSIEVELPFLQWKYREFSIVPIMLANQSRPIVNYVVDAISAVLDESKSMIIASSDLSHYKSKGEAAAYDQHLLSIMTGLDPDGVISAVEQEAAYACGAGPIAVVLSVCTRWGASRAKLLKYSTSAEVTGDPSSVVGYASVGIFKDG